MWVQLRGTSAGIVKLYRNHQFWIDFDITNLWVDYYVLDKLQRISRRKNLPM